MAKENMTLSHEDMKTVSIHRMSAYATHRKKKMSVDQFFKVQELESKSKTFGKFMKKLHNRA